MDRMVVRDVWAGAPMTPPATRVRALPLARLDALLAQAWDHRLTLIVAPAGSGKSTLLAGFVARAPGPVAWYRADAWDRDPTRMLRRLESAFRTAVPALPGGWETMDDALDALARPGLPDGTLLAVDDLHALAATDAERRLERLIEQAPATLTIVAASRAWPDMNLPRFKVAGELLEIDVGDLRFRSWEVERLFRDVYGQHLPPEEVAALTRRTEGWAAGLQLFHLASRGKSPAERRALLARLGRPASRLTGEYLSRNVLADLPADLGRFLVDTSVLGRLTGELCDELLGGAGSVGMLRELEARCLFTLPLADQGAYRYHEVFRMHLLGVLVESVGEAEARRRHLRAGELLARAGALPEALDALCRAEAWAQVASLLGRDGLSLDGGALAWTDAVPPSMLRTDPWMLLARARALRAQGRFRDAADAYAQAQGAFGDTDGAETAAAERAPLLPWLDVDPPRGLATAAGIGVVSPSVALRVATVRDPGLVAARPRPHGTSGAPLVSALALLLAGESERARVMLGAILDASDGPSLETVVARLALGVVRTLSGDPGGAEDIELAIGAAEAQSLEWLERVARACLVLGGRGGDADASDAPVAEPSPWVAAIMRAIDAWAAPRADGRAERLGAAATDFRRLGAPVIEAWLRALQAVSMASVDDPETEQVALGADALARTTGVAAARGLAQFALATARREDALARAATGILEHAGLLTLSAAIGGDRGPTPAEVPAGPRSGGPRVEVRCSAAWSFASTIDRSTWAQAGHASARCCGCCSPSPVRPSTTRSSPRRSGSTPRLRSAHGTCTRRSPRFVGWSSPARRAVASGSSCARGPPIASRCPPAVGSTCSTSMRRWRGHGAPGTRGSLPRRRPRCEPPWRCTAASCWPTRGPRRGSTSHASAAADRRSRRPPRWPPRVLTAMSWNARRRRASTGCASTGITTRCGGCSSRSGSAPGT
ncbi:MAG: hypothetical protein R3C32_12535 [Chloroflexota bacterium]